MLELIRDMTCPGKPLKYKAKQHAYRFTIDNKSIYEAIMTFVNDRRKSTHLHFPYSIPDTYLSHFVRGYSDGDGNIGVKYGRRTLNDGTLGTYYGLRYRVLGTRQFLEGLEFNLRRLGGAPNQVHPHKKNPENVYYIEYGFSAAVRVLDFLYQGATIMLPRKYQVYQRITHSDSNELATAYRTREGCYNMHSYAQVSA